MDSAHSLLYLFEFQGHPNPDIIVISFQEIIKLSAKNVIAK